MLLRPLTRLSPHTLRPAFFTFTRNPLPLRPMSTSASSPTAPSPSTASAQSLTPMQDAITHKLTAVLSPSTLEVHNDSHLHAHHAAMQSESYAGAKETHFRVKVISDAFKGKMQPARHRMVYALLKDELQREGGVHALQIVTRTPEEEEKSKAKG